MTVLALVGTWAAFVMVFLYLAVEGDRLVGDGYRQKFGRRLSGLTGRGLTAWLQGTNQVFLTMFERFYGGRGGLLEQGLWVALLLPPMRLVAVRGLAMVTEVPPANTNDSLLSAMGLAAGISLWYLSFLKLGELASRYSVTRRQWFATVGSFLVGVGFGLAGVGFLVSSILVGVVGLIGIILFAVGFGLIGSILFGSIFVGVGVGVGLVGSILVGSILVGVGVGVGPVGGILIGVFVGALVVLVGSVRIRFPVHPLKALASSLFFICIVGLIQRDATSSFFQAIQAEGFKLLAFVAFNVFADAISLLETLWVLRYGSNAGVPKLFALLTLDLALSAMIFLFLPLVLWEIPAFLEAALFRGDRPWLGILFWSTFSTSVLFYLFVAAALLVQPLAALARLFSWLSRPFNLEAHPVRCLAIAMALVVTVGFIAGGVVQAIVGSSGVTPPP